MKTEISIQGTDFCINGEPTYKGRYHEGRRIEGLLFNSRMVQAIFDDTNPETRVNWVYPDTLKWDPDRNTDDFCAALPVYRKHGLLGVTVGLQGGGPIYTSKIYDHYINSAFKWDGSLQKPYFERLEKLLIQTDRLGMVVILNLFYQQQHRHFDNDEAIRKAVINSTEWLLDNDHRNILIDINNEASSGSGLLDTGGIHELIDIIKNISRNNQLLLVGTSIHPRNFDHQGRWVDIVDFFLPHGNDSPGEKLRAEIKLLKKTCGYAQHPRPIIINEDSIDVHNLDIAVDEGVSWGFYSQGFGSNYRDFRWDWSKHERENTFDNLSGYQTPPINWGINTDFKKMFFNRVKTITGS